ncbi:MAG: hypothetical protein IJG86_00350 [Clostridia bacterium]|nr:hypothetical protein [Clostridia bacterium]
MTEIIVAVITGVITLIGTLIGVYWQNKATTDRITHTLDVKQAVTDTKLEELTREVRAHNGFAQRMPVVEEQIKVINHRLSDLEKGVTV